MEVCIFPTLLSVLVIPRHLWEVQEPSGHVAELELPSSLTLGGTLEEQSQELEQGCSVPLRSRGHRQCLSLCWTEVKLST